MSILPRSQFYKKLGKLAFSTSCTAVRPHRRLRNDAWRQDSLWRHNCYVTSQSTGHEPRTQRRTLVPKVAQSSLAIQFTRDDMPSNKWYYENMNKWSHETRGNYPFINFQATKISKRCVFVLATWSWRLPGEWPEACGSLTVVGAGIMHCFGTDPIRNPTIWLVESRNQVN